MATEESLNLEVVMSKVTRLQFSATIQAPAAVVWETLLGAETYPCWTRAFVEGSYYEGEWTQGSRIRFLSPSGDGMVAEVAESRPNEHMSIRHLGYIMNGVEDTESESVRAWAPAFENYTLISKPDGTRIVVDQDVTADFEEYMKDAWPKALELLRQICEEEAGA
jgi:uncharacterized protein YndB with AHSA1/START domain